MSNNSHLGSDVGCTRVCTIEITASAIRRMVGWLRGFIRICKKVADDEPDSCESNRPFTAISLYDFSANRAFKGLLINSAVALMLLSGNVAYSQAFPGANPNSAHPIDWCYISDTSGSRSQLVSPVGSLSNTIRESCANLDTWNTLYRYDVCNPIVSVEDGSVGGSWAGFSAYVVAVNVQDGTTQSGDGSVASCGCWGSGYGSFYSSNVGLGSDASCYCLAGLSWDSATLSCVPIKYYVQASIDPRSQCGAEKDCVGDPINPITGAVFDSTADTVHNFSLLDFFRYYNSADVGAGDLSGGWRHAFSRRIDVRNTAIVMQPHISSLDTSSQYADPSTACTSGFAEIKALVPQWSAAASIYVDGSCRLAVGGGSIGNLTVYSTGEITTSGSQPVVYDVVRDDGQLIRFTVINGIITPPPGTTLVLAETSIGFAVTDGNDTIETYDTTGKLLSITSRTGVVQTMSYDTSGRLSVVTDNFGHQLIFGYDAQNRLISVTRQ